MTDDKDLHNKVRDAIFLAALGSWEESCTFEELSEDGKQVYEGYATAALEALKDELALIRNQRLTDNMQAGWDALGLIRPVPADLPARCAELVGDVEVDLAAPLRADLECIADNILAATDKNRRLQDELRATVRQATAMEYAGCDAIAALRAVESNPGLSEAQHALVAEALLGMYAAKPRWLSRPETGRISPKLEGAA